MEVGAELYSRTSLRQLAMPLLYAIPGITYRVELTDDLSTGETSSGSFVALSRTDAYAETLPVDDNTSTSTRPSSSVMSLSDSSPLSARCSDGSSDCGMSLMR